MELLLTKKALKFFYFCVVYREKIPIRLQIIQQHSTP